MRCFGFYEPARHGAIYPQIMGGEKTPIGVSAGGVIRGFGNVWPWLRMVCRSEYLLHQALQRVVFKELT